MWLTGGDAPQRWYKRLGVELVADAEAFVLGSLVSSYEQRGDWVPPWAWLNLLAHANEQELASSTTLAPGPATHYAEWLAARSYLATEVLQVAATWGSLRHLQENALRPLELELAASPKVALWNPARLVQRTESVLMDYRSQHPRAQDAGDDAVANTEERD